MRQDYCYKMISSLVAGGVLIKEGGKLSINENLRPKKLAPLNPTKKTDEFYMKELEERGTARFCTLYGEEKLAEFINRIEL